MEIETGIPIPDRRQYDSKYGFGRLKVGQSILAKRNWNRNNVASAACAYGKRHGKVFVVRKTDDGLRIWRRA